MDVMRADSVADEIDRLIERRGKGAKKENVEEMLWKDSARRHHEAIRRRNKALWDGWHMDQGERHRSALTALIDHHEAQAASLCQEGRTP